MLPRIPSRAPPSHVGAGRACTTVTYSSARLTSPPADARSPQLRPGAATATTRPPHAWRPARGIIARRRPIPLTGRRASPASASQASNAVPAGAPQVRADLPAGLLRRVWAGEMEPLRECGVLPLLPPLDAVASSIAVIAGTSHSTGANPPWGAGSQQQGSPPRPAHGGGAAAAAFPAQAVYDSVLACVRQFAAAGDARQDGPSSSSSSSAAATALCVTAALCEHAERERARQVRQATATATAAAAAGGAYGAAATTTAAAAATAGMLPANTATDGDATDSDSGGDDGGEAGRGPPSLLAYVLGLTREQIVGMLAAVLREGPDEHGKLEKLVDELGADGVAHVLEATLGACRSGSQDVYRKDGGRRALGGVFFLQVQRHKASGALREAAAAAAERPLEAMRPYQRDVVGMVLASWGLPLTPGLLSGGGWAPAGAAGAQRADAARYRQLGGGWGGNWLVVAPTNSGKTLMAVEVARGVVAAAQSPLWPHRAATAGRGALVVVLVPTVLLTGQLRAYFERAGLPHTAVRDASSENPLRPGEWAGMAAEAARPAGRSQVLVATAAAFLNALRAVSEGGSEEGEALAAVDLLVLDEAHHCGGDHAYAAVVDEMTRNGGGGGGGGDGGGGGGGGGGADGALARLFAATTQQAMSPPSSPPPAPRILGLTASPASERAPDRLRERMSGLLGRLAARLHVLDPGRDPGVARAVPEPRELPPLRVPPRRRDRALAEGLQDFAMDVAQGIEADAAAGTGLAAVGVGAAAEVAVLRQSLRLALASCRGSRLAQYSLVPARVASLAQWLAQGRAFAVRYGCPRLDLSCRLVDILLRAAELVEDVGCEGVLPHLARKAAALCRAEMRAERSAAGRQEYFADATAVDGDPGGGGRTAGSAAAAAAAAGEPPELVELRALSAALPSPGCSAAAAAAASGDLLAAVPPGESCGDLSSRPSAWLARLMAATDGQSAGGTAGRRGAREQDGGGGADGPLAVLLRGGGSDGGWHPGRCFAPGETDTGSGEDALPKFAALVDYLAPYASRPAFHGVVFVRTRQAVFHLADMLRRSPRLSGVEVTELVGQGALSAATESDLLPGERDRASRGMGGRAQAAALQRFKGPGRQLLVATSAAEEGMDVPSCEFVVRYNAAATGTQLRQSRGRARVRGAEFVAILQEATLDEQLHAKSREEEEALREYTRRYAATEG